MKIGDLLVSLGFQIEGEQALAKVDTTMRSATVSALKMSAVVDGLNAVMFAMMKGALTAGQALRNFTLQTGLSTDELQRWQHVAAVNGVSANELTDTIKGLADARAQFALGNPQALGAWQMLGISPMQDPFKVLEQLRTRFHQIRDPNVARALAGEVGISDSMFTVLRSSNSEFERWNKNLALTQDQQARIVNLNKAWQDILFSVTSLRNRFMVELIPVFRFLAEVLRYVSQLGASFLEWLHSGGAAATVVKWALMAMAAVLIVLGVVLTGLTVVLGAVSAALFILDGAAWPVVAAVMAVAAAVLYLGGILTFNFLIINDWWTAFNGGASFFNWEKSIKIVNTLIGLFKDLKKAVTAVFDAGQSDFLEFFQNHPWVTTFGLSDPNNPNLPGFKNNFPGGVAPSQMRQENHTTINVHGTADPKSTAREVSRAQKEVNAAVSRQMPVLSY